ncbi:MAG TPA: apolipoprotein N-acyltransferase [Anaeromyxobacter sp.]|nr:apolipoprotein N-acyltransferase [Anaeromyxobacter sp.]
MRRLLPLAAALASGAATALALPLVVPFLSIRPVDPGGRLEVVAWVSLVPAFLALRGCRGTWRAALLGLLAGLAYFFCAIYWVSHAMTAFGGLSLPMSLLALTLLVLYMAAHWALAFGVSARVRARLGWPLWAILPPAWTGAELLRNYLFSGFPWADLGYTQVRTLPVAQLASLVGVYGIAALVVLVNAALAELAAAVAGRRAPPIRPLAVAAAVLALAVGYGELHLASVRAQVLAAPTIEVGVVQPNVDQSVRNGRRQHEEYILERLVGPTVEADRAGADLVAWPEASYPFDVPPGVRSFDVPGAGIPRLGHAHLLVGAPTVEWLPGPTPGARRVPRVGNMLFLLDPDLQVLGSYQKLHLVPFGEYVPEAVRILLPFVKQLVPTMAAVSPGKDYSVLQFRLAPAPAGPAAAERPATVRAAPLICYDAIFPEIVRAFAREAPPPDILVNGTNDAWYGYSSGPYQFLAIVQLRAIEAARTVVRPAYAGVSAVVLPTGELAPGAIDVGPVDPDLAPDRDEPARLLLARAPLLRGRTLYTTIGDLFAYGCALAAAGALLAAWVRKGSRAERPRVQGRP